MNNLKNSFVDVTNAVFKLFETFKAIYIAYLEDNPEVVLYNPHELTKTWDFLKECVQKNNNHTLRKFLTESLTNYMTPLPTRPLVSQLLIKRVQLLKAIQKKLNPEIKDLIETSDQLIHEALFLTLKLLLISYDELNDTFFDEFKILFKHHLIQQIQLKNTVKSIVYPSHLEISTPISLPSSLNTPISFYFEKELPITDMETSSSPDSQIPLQTNLFKPILTSYPQQTPILPSLDIIEIMDSALKILNIVEDIYIAYLEANQQEVLYNVEELYTTCDFLKDCIQKNNDDALKEFLKNALTNYINPLPKRPFVSALLSKRIELIKCIRENLHLDPKEYIEISENLFIDCLFLALKLTFDSYQDINQSFFNDLKTNFKHFLLHELQFINSKSTLMAKTKPQYFVRTELLTPSPKAQSTISTPLSTVAESESLDLSAKSSSISEPQSPTNEGLSANLENLSIFTANLKIVDGYDSDGNEVRDIFIL